ncbi:MAG: TAXI family TRAP transporter solute-binding subunit [Acidimicrobiia bacterium]|nr:TAXI family TRAP transporter solute-binding subunit [Acidimicrobiia bacterium]
MTLLAACSPIEEDGDGEEEGGDTTTAAEETGGGDTTTGDDTATTAASGDGGGEGGQLSIATGGTGGVYYPLGGGFATVIRENVEGYDGSVMETNASVDNMLLIQNGDADLALALGDTVALAVAGEADFEGAPVEACAIGKMYSNFTQLVTSGDSGIASVADLEGMRVSLGSPGSGTEVIALRILEAAGLDPDADIERLQLGVDETTAGLRDGTIDAGFWSGGLPTGALVEYATTGDMVIVPTADFAEDLASTHGPYYLAQDIPADTYENQSEPVPTIVVPNILVVSSEMDEELQQNITAAIFDNKEQLVQVHPAAEEFDAATADDVEFVDICPGSQAYYDEQG